MWVILVEMTGIEPVSENLSTQLSPGAFCYFYLPYKDANRQASMLGSPKYITRERALPRNVHH